MLDAQVRRIIDDPLDATGRWLAGVGVRANPVTVAGFVVGMAAVPALAVEAYGWALVAIIINRVADGLDGAVARAVGTTDFGGYLDIVLDFIFYSAVVFGFVLARPENAVAASFLMLSFVGTGASFLAYAIIAAKKGVETSTRGRKSFFHMGGLTEGTETIGLFVLISLVPDWFVPAAWIFGVMAFITAASRIAIAWESFRD